MVRLGRWGDERAVFYQESDDGLCLVDVAWSTVE